MIASLLVPSVVLAVGTLLVVHALLRDRKRRRALERWGAGRGLASERSAGAAGPARWGTSVREELGRLPSMTARVRQSFSHVLRNADQIVCDWRIVGGPKDRPRRVAQTLVAFRHEGADLPSFRLACRANRSAFGDRRDVPIVELATEPGVPDRLVVAGPDATVLQRFFDAARRNRLELPEELVVEGGGEWVACYVPRRRIPEPELAGFVERARVVCDPLLDD
jgi:hypothetical protein